MKYCYLMNMEDGKEWEFLAITENSLSFNVNFNTVEIYRGVAHPVEFQKVSNTQRSFTVGLNASKQGKGCDEIFNDFKKLCKPPVLLGFQWGATDVLAPCVITGDVRYTKKDWAENITLSAELSFTLMQVSTDMVIK
jgi:hypothetical protein